MITLDGVMQAPGRPEEDASGGFKYGGWVAPYGDEVYSKVVEEQMKPADLLLGRKTFEIWADYWRKHADNWPGINEVKKYVASSNSAFKPEWNNSILLTGDVVEKIKKLKQRSVACMQPLITD